MFSDATVTGELGYGRLEFLEFLAVTEYVLIVHVKLFTMKSTSCLNALCCN